MADKKESKVASIEIEICQIDLRYESFRMRNAFRENLLLASINSRGIEEPVCGLVSPEGRYVLLDGFKRVRCALKLGISQVRFFSLGGDEVDAILQLIRIANAKSLSMLEQAKLVDELIRVFGLSVEEVSERLMRSKAWVRVRRDVLHEMSSAVMTEILTGRFPLYSYIYTLRPGRRLIGSASKDDIEKFIRSVSGKALSTREIELLAYGYFRGGLRPAIEGGHLSWCLSQLKQRSQFQTEGSVVLNEQEQKVLSDLEFLRSLMGRLVPRLEDQRLSGMNFLVEAEILVSGILRVWQAFERNLRSFYDRCGVREGHFPIKSAGHGDPGHESGAKA